MVKLNSKNFIDRERLDLLPEGVHQAAREGNLKYGHLFTEFYERSTVAFNSIACVIDLLQASRLRQVMDDKDEVGNPTEHPYFSPNDETHLMNMVSLLSDSYAREGQELAEWVNNNTKKMIGGGGHD